MIEYTLSHMHLKGFQMMFAFLQTKLSIFLYLQRYMGLFNMGEERLRGTGGGVKSRLNKAKTLWCALEQDRLHLPITVLVFTLPSGIVVGLFQQSIPTPPVFSLPQSFFFFTLYFSLPNYNHSLQIIVRGLFILPILSSLYLIIIILFLPLWPSFHCPFIAGCRSSLLLILPAAFPCDRGARQTALHTHTHTVNYDEHARDEQSMTGVLPGNDL